MYRRIVCGLLCLCLLGAFVPVQVGAAKGHSEGFYYEVSGSEAIITGSSLYLSGRFTVPSVLDGYPVTAIGEGAFQDRTGLTAVIIPEGVKVIGSNAFRQCARLAQLTLPNSLTTIGEGAFRGCGMETVTIPEQVTAIGDMAFFDNDKLRNVTVPASVSSIGGGAFSDCLNLPAVTVGEDHPYYRTAADGSLYSKDQAVLCFVPQSTTGSYRIVDGVRTLGDYVFYYCGGLQSVILPEGITAIGAHAFAGCTLLAEAAIPQSVKTLGASAFDSCGRLSGVTLPEGLTGIGSRAFYGCSRIAQLRIPAGVAVLDDYALYCCTGLEEVTLSEGLTHIRTMAFGYCEKLTAINIPKTVAFIGCRAFYQCTALKAITFDGAAPGFENNCFEGVTATASYLACAEGWSAETCRNYQGKLTWQGQFHRFPEQDPFGQCSCGAYKSALGDVTGDGQINIGDVAKLYRCICQSVPVPPAVGDLTGDGRINLGDVAKLFVQLRRA